jgi:hypothetical protein
MVRLISSTTSRYVHSHKSSCNTHNFADPQSLASSSKAHQIFRERKNKGDREKESNQGRRRLRRRRRLNLSTNLARPHNQKAHRRSKTPQALQDPSPTPAQLLSQHHNLPHNRRPATNLQRPRRLPRLPCRSLEKNQQGRRSQKDSE